MPYTSRQEIVSSAIKPIVEEERNCISSLLVPSSTSTSDPSHREYDPITATRLLNKLTPSPDLLIRTSGEHRLSDFLLPQTSCNVNRRGNTRIMFVDCLWPEFGAGQLLWCLLTFLVSS